MGTFKELVRQLEKNPKEVERDGRRYRIMCPECGSGAVIFDAHAGFSVCQSCSYTTQFDGPDKCYRLIQGKDSGTVVEG